MGDRLLNTHNREQNQNNKYNKYRGYGRGKARLHAQFTQESEQRENNECEFFLSLWRGINRQTQPKKEKQQRPQRTKSTFKEVEFKVVQGRKKPKGISVRAEFKCSSMMQRSMSGNISNFVHLRSPQPEPRQKKQDLRFL